MPYIRAFTLSRTGKTSHFNEDCFLSSGYVPDSYSMEMADQPVHEHQSAITTRQTACFAVFSGIGDKQAARLAAQTAAEELKDEVPRLQMLPLKDIDSLFRRATGEVLLKFARMAEVDPSLAGIGANFTCIAMRGGQAAVHSIGGGKVFAYRAGQIRLLNAGSDTGKSLDLQSDRGNLPITGSDAFDLRENDRYLICSPGMAGALDENTIRSCLEIQDPQQAARQLVNLASDRSGYQSMTCTVIVWKENEPERKPATNLSDIAKRRPAGEKIEHEPRDLDLDLKIKTEKPAPLPQRNDYWEHFPVWAGYVGLAIIAALALLLYLGIKYF